MKEFNYINLRLGIQHHRAQKLKQAEVICIEEDLDDEWALIKRNEPLRTNPYHNVYHTACMIVNAAEAYNYYSNDEGKYPNEDRKFLIAACLFHDYDHSGGKLTDKMNIAYANKAVLENKFWSWTESDAHAKQEIIKLICVTEFPFIREPLTLQEQIIRDCDLLQMLEPDWMDQIFVGLYTEMLNNTAFKDMSPSTFLTKQIEFLDNAKFYTKWFEETRRDKWNAAIDYVRGINV